MTQKFFLFRAKQIETEFLSKIAREANLTLSAKKVFEPEPKNPERKPQTHWAAINAAHKNASENKNSLVLARGAGIEPTIADLEAAVIPLN